ncbi:hypothetical protein B0T22DRAFT_21626 [Podospora appendiculata]|uniref:Uncharacterized protein n=1 Tax=Podospora appendiculata TaxID=314037 RepID=A0AAE0XG68_9PEZI|nr:hypothetical protein B0T22DRAFT_21626 [Podospora appendiculata]
MLFSRYNSPLVWAVLFPSLLCAASPTPVVDIAVSSQPQHDPLFREALELAHQPHLEKRLSADFNLERSWENHVLFAGSWTAPGTAPGVTETVSLSVTCINCWTKGVVTAKLSEDIVKPSVRLDFTGVEAYVDVGVDVSDGAVYAVNLFSSETPLGLGFPGLSVGLVFYVDLVFSLTAKIDLEGGFYVKLADDAFLEASIFGGDITDSFL